MLSVMVVLFPGPCFPRSPRRILLRRYRGLYSSREKNLIENNAYVGVVPAIVVIPPAAIDPLNLSSRVIYLVTNVTTSQPA